MCDIICEGVGISVMKCQWRRGSKNGQICVMLLMNCPLFEIQKNILLRYGIIKSVVASNFSNKVNLIKIILFQD